MARSPRLSDADDARFEDFIRAGIGDLSRLMGTHGGIADAEPSGRRLPAVPQAAQLSVFLLLVLQGTEPKYRSIFPHLKRLNWHLNKVYSASKQQWEAALSSKTPKARESRLKDTGDIEPFVEALVSFADRKFGLTPVPLSTYGVTDVQVALGTLVQKMTGAIGTDLGLPMFKTRASATKATAGKKPGAIPADIPDPVLGGLLVASIGADIGIRGSVTQDHTMAIRCGVGIGTGPNSPAKPENAKAKRVRRTLEELAEHLDDGEP